MRTEFVSYKFIERNLDARSADERVYCYLKKQKGSVRTQTSSLINVNIFIVKKKTEINRLVVETRLI